MSKRALYPGMLIVLGILLAATLAGVHAAQLKSDTVRVGNADIGGVVTGAAGPEAGVWVIAETADLPTKFVKIVVTDDQGRYLVPDLPKANYSVWARGYGLVDSPKVQAEPGTSVDLKPTVAPDAKTAAQIYPGNYWYAMLKVPEKKVSPPTRVLNRCSRLRLPPIAAMGKPLAMAFPMVVISGVTPQIA